MKNLICLMALLFISTNSFAVMRIPGEATYRKMKSKAANLKLRLKYAGDRDWVCNFTASGQKKTARIQLIRSYYQGEEISGYLSSREMGLRGDFHFSITDKESSLSFNKGSGLKKSHSIKKVRTINLSKNGVKVSCKKD